MNSPKVKVFIGSGEQSLLERKVLIYSLQKNTDRDLDIHVFNGTHNAVETSVGPPAPAPLPLHLKYRNLTEFSLYRYLIPELCLFEGRAIYLDSDMVCLGDIGELFDSSVNGYDFLAKREYADQHGEKMWALSTLLIDCEACRFDLSRIFGEIDRGLYTYSEFSQMGKKFLARHPYRIGEIDSEWNVFDRSNAQTKLIHYTNQFTQPWKYPGHAFGEIWFSYLWDALAAGWVTEGDIDLAMQRGHARPDLRAGNNPSRLGRLKALLRWR
jgi:lipopolysaccharide biosynthesis glycosyltransferase